MGKIVEFQEFKNKKMDERALTVRFSDEHVFVIPPIELWDQDLIDAFSNQDFTRVVDVMTDGAADLLKADYGCSPMAFITMVFENFGIDVGKAVAQSLESLAISENMVPN